MSSSPPSTRRIQTASEVLGLGFFYLAMVTFVVYVLFEAMQSGIHLGL